MIKRAAAAACCLTVFLAFPGGCILDFFGSKVKAPVTIPAMAPESAVSESSPDYGFLTEEFTIEVKSSGAKSCQEGVKALRNRDWSAARTGFQQAVSKNPKDHAAYFGLGIVCEVQQDYGGALQNYRSANLIPKNMNPTYDAAVRRVEAKQRYRSGGAR